MTNPQAPRGSLAQLVERRILQTTHGRIRGLKVEEVHGRLIVLGEVPSQYTRQLALHGALELISGERMRANITVG